MEDFIASATLVVGEVVLIGTAVYAGIKRAWPVLVAATALAMYFVAEAVRAVQ
jgi:hypothetical protein